MNGPRVFVVAVLLGAAWFGRGLVDPGAEPDDEPFIPIARYVEAEPISFDWAPNPDVRDPFSPLVLPTPPAADAGSDPVG